MTSFDRYELGNATRNLGTGDKKFQSESFSIIKNVYFYFGCSCYLKEHAEKMTVFISDSKSLHLKKTNRDLNLISRVTGTLYLQVFFHRQVPASHNDLNFSPVMSLKLSILGILKLY